MQHHTRLTAHLLALIKHREGTHTEFKRAVPASHKLAKEITALANTRGGNILIGVDDTGMVVGVEDTEDATASIMNAGRSHCFPPIEPEIQSVSIDGKTVLWVVITPSDNRHAVIDRHGNTRIYVRVADKALPASKKTARILNDGPAIRLRRKNLDRHETRLLEYLSRHEKITQEDFCRQANLSRRRAARILVKLEKAALIRSHDFDKYVFYTLNPKR